MRHVMVLSLVVAAGALAFACGDDDDDKGSGFKTCEGQGAAGTSGCSDTQIKAYGECVENACQDKYAECYGPGYKSGNFSGVCGSYMECTQACDCGDSACYQACQASSECTSCMTGFVSCSSSCQDKLQCAFGDSGISFGDAGISFGDAGISFGDGSITVGDATIGNGKTCADLATCCNSLSDTSKKSECTMVRTQLMSIGSFGDVACGEAIADYCP